MTQKHSQILSELVEKYSKDKNVVGIYLFGSLAKGRVKPNSDIDLEVVFKKKSKNYQLVKKKLKGVNIDLSQYREDNFIKEFKEHPYLMYSALNYKILYDPKGLLKRNLLKIKIYFSKNPKVLKFWLEKEKTKTQNYFKIMEQLRGKLK